MAPGVFEKLLSKNVHFRKWPHQFQILTRSLDPSAQRLGKAKSEFQKNDLWRKKELELANKPYGLSANFNHSFINYKSTTIEISNCNYSLLIVRVIICPKVIFFFNSAHGTVLHQGSRMRKIVQFGGNRNIEFLFFISRKKTFLFFFREKLK